MAILKQCIDCPKLISYFLDLRCLRNLKQYRIYVRSNAETVKNNKKKSNIPGLVLSRHDTPLKSSVALQSHYSHSLKAPTTDVILIALSPHHRVMKCAMPHHYSQPNLAHY